MQIFTAIAVSVLAWMVAILVFFALFYREVIEGSESNMAICFFLQAAIPVAVFWWLTHRPAF
jgi:hypothetical protein